jgi:hypothetical protein
MGRVLDLFFQLTPREIGFSKTGRTTRCLMFCFYIKTEQQAGHLFCSYAAEQMSSLSKHAANATVALACLFWRSSGLIN